MHKSGTTLISQILHRSGIDMGQFDENISYDAGNKYERHEIQALNVAILNCDYTHSLDIIRPIDKLPDGSHLKGEVLALIAKLSADYQNWGFKDPRTCLTYPIWRAHLPVHRIIYTYRSPLEVWHHYRKYIPRYKIFTRIRQGYKALRAWHVYNGQLLRFSNVWDKEGLFINFSQFVNDQASIFELQDYIGLSLTDCRNKRLYRSKAEEDIFYNFCAALLAWERKPHVEILYAELEEKRKLCLSR
jgi:hypothetical protein